MSSGASSLEKALVDELGESPGNSLLGDAVSFGQIDLALDQAKETGKSPFRLIREADGPAKRGRGRPKNAKNKASQDIAKLLAHKGIQDPVLYMAELYNTPVDQLAALALHADGTIERQSRLDTLIERAVENMERLTARLKLVSEIVTGDHVEAARELQSAVKSLVHLSATSATKPGDIAIKIINAQLAAAKAVAEYTHSKRPVEAKVQLEALPTIVMPGVGADKNYSEADAVTKLAGQLVAKALSVGQLTPESLHGMEMRDGQLVIDGEAVEVERGADGDDPEAQE